MQSLKDLWPSSGVDEGVMEAALWLFTTAVQGDSSAQKQGLSALPDLVRLLDKGACLQTYPFTTSVVLSFGGPNLL